jgi:hypothetical protein
MKTFPPLNSALIGLARAPPTLALGLAPPPQKKSETTPRDLRNVGLIIRSLVIRLAVAILPFLVGCSHSGHPSPERQGGPSPLSTKLWAGCSINLKLIDTAKQQWADEKHRSVKDPAPTWDDLGEYIGRGSNNAILPECPCGGTYTIGSLNQTAKCSLSPEEHTHERKEAYEASKTLKRQNSP